MSTASSSPDRKSTILVLRSLANSRKEASLADLVRDYAETEGGHIPFARFGYRSLEEFLKDSGEFRVTPWQTVQVRSSQVSSHINKLVAEQKTNSSSGGGGGPRKKMLPQRQIHSPSRTQSPSVYSNAFQNMKLRSPVKQHYPGGGGAASFTNQSNQSIPATNQQQHHKAAGNWNHSNSNNGYNGNSGGQGGGYSRSSSQQDSSTRNTTGKANEKPQVTDLRQKLNRKTSNQSSPPQSPTPPQPSAKSNESPVSDRRQKLNRKVSNQTPPQSPSPDPSGTKSNESLVKDLRQKLNRKANPLPLTAPAPSLPKETTPPQQPSATKPAFVLRTSAPSFCPQQTLPSMVVPNVEPPVSRLQQRLRIATNTDSNTRTVVAHIEPSTPPPAATAAASDSAPSAQLPVAKPTVRSKLSDRLIQRPVAPIAAAAPPPSVPPPRKVTPPAAPAVSQPAGYPYDQPPPSNGGQMPQQDPITALAVYSKSLGFGIPEYKILRVPKTNRVQCRVMIKNVSYSSYPNDFETMREAKLFTAVETLVQLQQRQQQERFPVCMDLESDLVVKVFECLKESAHGVFVRRVPELFQKTYRESLPSNWERLMMKTPNLFTFSDSIENTQIVYANLGNTNEVMSNPAATTTTTTTTTTTDRTPSAPINHPSNASAPPSESTTSAAGLRKSPSLSVEVESTNSQDMQKLVLPWSEKYWNLFITNPKSSVEIWARLIGAEYSDLMDNLIVDIELDLMQNRIRPSTVKVGHIYLVVVSECTYRVRVDRLDFAQSRCLCFYIDNGDEEWFPLDQIYVCKAQFLQFPAQAICLSLFGLEDCAENPNAHTHLDAVLTNKTLIADVASKRDDYEKQEASLDETARVVVALYDTSSDEDVQLNNVILDRICEDGVTPTLRPIGITNVQIGHVTDDGEVFCQLRTTSGGIHYVQKLIHHLVQFGFNPDNHRYVPNDDKATRTLVGGEPQPPVYLVQDADDQKWYRASIVGRRNADDSQYEMFYVDVGARCVVPADRIYRLDSMCVVLYKYPFQAIACRLFEVHEITTSMVASLRCYLSPGTSAMFKVMASRNKVPFVKIFIRYQDGPLVCINDTIQLEEEIENSPEIIDDSAPIFGSILNTQPPAISSRPPSSNGQHHNPHTQQQRAHALPKVDLPRPGDTFQLHVTMASNPYNFKVQPHKQVPAFQQMMVELQEYCAHTPAYVPDADVQMSEIYACQQDDNVWYRAIVQNVCSASMFLISYCDYGDIVVVNSDRLKVLPKQFRQIPALAIKAKLFGVTPKNQDWETDDCLQFQRMCVDKKFVSIVHKVGQVGASDDDVQLELTLIDVSTDTDIDINKMLVLEDRAVAMV